MKSIGEQLVKIFQSTLSVRRATGTLEQANHRMRISIHALRKESDIFPERNDTTVAISIHALRKESDT